MRKLYVSFRLSFLTIIIIIIIYLGYLFGPINKIKTVLNDSN